MTDGVYSMTLQAGASDGQIGPVEELQAGEPDNSSDRRYNNNKGKFDSMTKNLSLQLFNRYGIEAKSTSILFYCKPMTGRR